MGTYDRGMQILDLAAREQEWNAHGFPTLIRPVAWSPDGSILAGGGDDGTIYVWYAKGSTLREMNKRHGIIHMIGG